MAHHVGIDQWTHKRRRPKHKLRSGLIKGEVLLATGNPQQRINRHLQHRHACAYREERHDRHGIGRMQREAQRTSQRSNK
jgi:hypothetical protein